VERDGTLLIVDDERFRLAEGEAPAQRQVRVRTLGRVYNQDSQLP